MSGGCSIECFSPNGIFFLWKGGSIGKQNLNEEKANGVWSMSKEPLDIKIYHCKCLKMVWLVSRPCIQQRTELLH